MTPDPSFLNKENFYKTYFTWKCTFAFKKYLINKSDPPLLLNIEIDGWTPSILVNIFICLFIFHVLFNYLSMLASPIKIFLAIVANKNN